MSWYRGFLITTVTLPSNIRKLIDLTVDVWPGGSVRAAIAALQTAVAGIQATLSALQVTVSGLSGGGGGGGGKSGILALTFGSTVATDASANLKFTLNVTGAFTLGVPTGLANGDVCVWTFQRTSGSGDITLDANFALPLDLDGNPTAMRPLATIVGHYNILLATYDAVAGKMRVGSFLEFAA